MKLPFKDFAPWILAFFIMGFVSCNLHSGNSSQSSTQGVGALSFDSANGGLILPKDFKAVVVAKNLGPTRHIIIRDNGDIYVALKSEKHGGGIVALQDTNGDGKAEVIRYFGNMHGTGIGIYHGYLYFGSDTAIWRFKLRKDSLLPDLQPQLVAQLPDQNEHRAKSITFDHHGNLYVSIGAPSNACQALDRTKGSKGLQPCPLLENHAGIWRFKADSLNQSEDAGGFRYATGLRNCVALDWNSHVHQLYAAMNGRDQLSQLFPQYYTDSQSAELPAEEFLLVKKGGNYGWPYVYYDQIKKKLMVEPEYGGNGKIAAPAGKYENPILAFPGHWAPLGLLFYTGHQFPSTYLNGAFIAFHGSWNRAPLPQAGYKVVFVPFNGEMPIGNYSVFADGFSGYPPNLQQPGNAKHRPVGLAQGPDGSLYITDDSNGTIWRIVYTGTH
ncbi:MAG: PQQ-dependent sugar dehydrogenase [Chitinophagaceae bacterium]